MHSTAEQVPSEAAWCMYTCMATQLTGLILNLMCTEGLTVHAMAGYYFMQQIIRAVLTWPNKAIIK